MPGSVELQLLRFQFKNCPEIQSLHFRPTSLAAQWRAAGRQPSEIKRVSDQTGEAMEKSTETLDQQIEQLRQTSSYVSSSYRLANNELTALKQSLVLFAEANALLAKRLMALEAIRPRIVDVDGRKLRWDAPDEIVPVDVF